MLSKRKALSAAERKQAAEKVARGIAARLPSTPGLLAGYVSILGECDPLPALLAAHEKGWRLALPRVDEAQKTLSFHMWKPDDPLQAAAHGTRQPSERAQVVVPDVILVPLVAFDASLHRLGYGAGYYDKALATHAGSLNYGLAYAFQKVEKLPIEAHDIGLHGVFTERETFLR